MNKAEFMALLRARLSGVPQEEVDERLGFYSELIDDSIEDGISEQDAVAKIGSADKIADQILSEIPLARLAKKKIRSSRRLAAWEIVLLAIGSPLWLSLGIAAASVVFSLYVVIWSLVVCAWAIFASLCACALGGIAAGIIFICTSSVASGIVTIGASIFLGGLAIFAFWGCNAATVGAVWLTKKIVLGIKKCFVKKEAV